MWQAILNFLRTIFSRQTPDEDMPAPTFTRTATEAAALSARSLETIAREPTGRIPCPWHQEYTPSCAFDNSNRTFHCYGCARNGNIQTLITRLQSPGVYVEGVR
jgi:hypothetical protein